MLRFIYVIIMNLFRAPYIIPKMRKWADHPEKYSETGSSCHLFNETFW